MEDVDPQNRDRSTGSEPTDGQNHTNERNATTVADNVMYNFIVIHRNLSGDNAHSTGDMTDFKAPSTPATMSKQLATLSKLRSTLSKQHSTLSKEIVQVVAFDNVAWTLLLVWKGLNMSRVTYFFIHYFYSKQRSCSLTYSSGITQIEQKRVNLRLPHF